MKKRISTRAICLLVAVIVLAGALTVSAINGSPYENLKNAAINALFHENVTMELEATVRMNDEVLERVWMQRKTDGHHNLTMEMQESAWMRELDDHTRAQIEELFTGMNYESPDLSISMSNLTPEGTRWYRANYRDRSWLGNDFSTLGNAMFGSNGGRDSNYLRLTELAVDLVVGDLKNNFVMSTHGDIRRVSGAINESQMPEIARLLIDIAIEENLRWRNTEHVSRDDFNHVLDIPLTNISIDRVSIVADIDQEGNLADAHVVGTATLENIFGDVHNFEVELNMQFSNIGTTVVTPPIPGAVELFTPEFFEQQFGFQWTTAHFTLDQYGNIDMGSLTDEWPSNSISIHSPSEAQVSHILNALNRY